MTKHTSPRALAAGALLAVSAKDDLGDPTVALEAINRAFDEFKASHEAQLKDLKNGFDDVVTKDKISKIDASLGDLQAVIDNHATELAALKTNGTGDNDQQETAQEREYRAKFMDYVRGRDAEAIALQDFAKANGIDVRAAGSAGSADDGGYTAPVEWDRTITNKRVQISPMRRYASVQSPRGQGFKRLYNTGGTTSGWVGETDARPQTNTSKLKEYAYSFGELYAMPAATQRILDDSEINFAGWLADEVNVEFAKQEGVAFINGDGVDKPKGLLRFTSALETALPANQRHPLGPIAEVVSGAANDLSMDGLIDLIYDLPEDRSQGAALYGNRKTWARVRKFRDAQGQYLWQPPVTAGQPATVFGQPSVELSGMPDIAANAIPLVYGNMAQAYRIFDIGVTRVLRDPYTAKPYVLFYTTQRVGGGLWNPEWMRYHKVAAS